MDIGMASANYNVPAFAVLDALSCYCMANQQSLYLISGGTGSGGTTGNIYFVTGGTNSKSLIKGQLDVNGNWFMGMAALATNATNGFIYIRSGPGAPTGVPTSKTGMIPLYFDSTNNNLYIYNGSWKKTTTFA